MERTEKINFSITILDSTKNVKIKLIPTQILTLMNLQKCKYCAIAFKQLVIDYLTVICFHCKTVKKKKKRGDVLCNRGF